MLIIEDRPIKFGTGVYVGNPGLTELDISENPDAEYMEKCSEVDHNRPETWKPYKNVPVAIIDMEYNELKRAVEEKDPKMIEENIYHLSVACLNYWRKLKAK